MKRDLDDEKLKRKGKFTKKAFKISAAANGLCGKSSICGRIYFHQPVHPPQCSFSGVRLYFILGALSHIFPPSVQYLGSRVDYSLSLPSSTISPVMRQRDYQLLRFPHCNINIGLSSQFSSSRFCPGLSIIWLGLQRDYPSCARFICATFHYPFLIILPLSFSSPQPLIIPVFHKISFSSLPRSI